VRSRTHDGSCKLFNLQAALTAWAYDPVPTIGAGVAALGYFAARRRLISSPDAVGIRSYAGRGRMICFCGGPLGLLLRTDPPWLPRRVLVPLLRSRPVRMLAHPLTALGLFTVVLVGTHLTPLYNLALEHQWLHELEHAAFFLTALLFWWPAIGVDPAPHRLSYPARLLYLFLDMPVMAYLGLAIANSPRVLYPYYAAHPPPWGASALADQGVAGTIMWIAGTFTMVPAMAVVFLRWLDEDARRQARREARQAPAAPPAGGVPHRDHTPATAPARPFRSAAP
jgi:hypothetical protein